MPEYPEQKNTSARDAAFGLAFRSGRSSYPFANQPDLTLLPMIRERAPGASPEECLEALAVVRNFYDAVYDVSEAFREGRFGTGADGTRRGIDELARRQPGFSGPEYEEAFAAGLFWTAF